ncbi:uncharacterized protein LOC131955145 [Physella acuta]|uniref:uncharacterized protein LOC131955145 n=1 Tax=Physella acuta TaxID=109671 RepID=UPI0027DBD10D|nr:uncharacterized protein LOC131955145 [Physella acuta]
MNRQEFCVQIVKGLENVWDENILFDFAVKVQNDTIKCHRLILAACSDFFKALFRSGMKEANEKFMVLDDVSCEVFRLILNSIYTGTSLITPDNFIEVWRTAHMLQVNFLVKFCEEFAIETCSLDTWENIYFHAELLCSEKVLDHLRNFMLKNFEHIRCSKTFLELSFAEFQNFIKSQDLVVVKEDLVLESVINWIHYVPTSRININKCLNDNPDFSIRNNHLTFKNVIPSGDMNEFDPRVDNPVYEPNQNGDDFETNCEQGESLTAQSADLMKCVNSSRKSVLPELLKLVRTCLVSPATLCRVLKMNLFLENKDSRELILDAMSHHVQEFRHGQWSSAAIHRSCSEYINGGVFVRRGGWFYFLTACKEEVFIAEKCKYLEQNIQLVSFDGELYATGRQNIQQNGHYRMFVFCGSSWKEVMEMPSYDLLLVSHGDFIYVINKDDKVLYNVNPKKRKPNLEKITDFPSTMVDVNHAMILENFLLLFCSESVNGVEQIAVHKFEILSKVWTRLDNLDGPAEQLISFKNDKHNYILHTNGSLWQAHACEPPVEGMFHSIGYWITLLREEDLVQLDLYDIIVSCPDVDYS